MNQIHITDFSLMINVGQSSFNFKFTFELTKISVRYKRTYVIVLY